jgi:hypothetical protein
VVGHSTEIKTRFQKYEAAAEYARKLLVGWHSNGQILTATAVAVQTSVWWMHPRRS